MNYTSNKNQNKLITNLVNISRDICPSLSIEETSLFFSFFYVIVLLKISKERKKSFKLADYSNEINVLRLMFPSEVDFFTTRCNTLDDYYRQLIFKLLKDIEPVSNGCDNTISWLYQSMKKTLERDAFEKVGKNKNKIKGKDILYTTQFFTDEYMVKYLVDFSIKENYDNIENVVFIDPALGGGNFLSYTFVELYRIYSLKTELSSLEIVKKIVEEQLLGYDLDSHLTIIAKLSLYINIAAKVGLVFIKNISYYGGIKDDLLGFMSNSIKSTTVNNDTFQSKLNKLLQINKRIVYITNPPFMGKRDMEISLKDKLINDYPQCKGDLCFSFMHKLMDSLREHDMIAIVSQNGWLNLATLKGFRENIIKNYDILSCVDLGSNAFAAINGEKTNVVLTTIKTKQIQHISKFYNLKNFSYKGKIDSLSDYRKLSQIEFQVDLNDFKAYPSYEFSYELVNSFLSLNELDTYSCYANPMQGSSTGNNKEYVRFLWEPGTDGKEWKLVSKGGGFSKWQGLNIYKVKWGNNGELVMNNPGSAIRNLKEICNTELVYSDTGTLGLNVRLLLKDQIFIASGPGIKVLDGDKYCHIAFLNSKIATFLLKIKNPKFTISAGYIGKLPVKKEMLFSKRLANLAKLAINSKIKLLKHKLPNVEFCHEDYIQITDVEEYIDDAILSDIANYKIIVHAENKINTLILKMFEFNEKQKNLIIDMIGRIPTKTTDIDVDILDKSLSSKLNSCCMPISSKLEGHIIGSDNIVEMLSFEFNASIDSVSYQLVRNIRKLKKVRQLYKYDLIHKLILKVYDINLESSSSKILSAQDIITCLSKEYNQLIKSLEITPDIIEYIINNIHYKGFMSKPIFTIK